MNHESSNSGFGSKTWDGSNRLVNKDGSFNVIKTGREIADRFSLYHWFLNMTWSKFCLIVIIGYLVINCLFAGLYLLAGFENLQGTVFTTPSQKFLSALYFSAQTFTTVGYGRVNPIGHLSNAIACIEALIGLMAFALMTGLIYGRFSKPKAEIMFSDTALISPYEEGLKAFMFRMANSRDSQMSDVSVKLMLARNESIDGRIKKRFYPLKLELDRIFFFATTWTVVHPIDSTSPFFNKKAIDLEREDFEILIQVEGYDDTFSQDINDRTSYKWYELEWEAKFESIVEVGNGKPIVKLEDLSKTYRI